MNAQKWVLDENRFFDPDPSQRRTARELYESVQDLPIISPHGHVDPALFASEEASFGSPAELLIIPDHYIFRMLYSQGVPLEDLGVPRKDGKPVEQNHRKIWQTFADHFHLFRGTPSGIWLAQELVEVFGVQVRLTGETAMMVYDQVAEKLASPEFRPRALFERFNIEVLCTTDAAADPLTHHRAIRESGWKGRIRPTFRPDAVVNLDTPAWKENLDALSKASGLAIDSYAKFIQALAGRRRAFIALGATATDHAALTPRTTELSLDEAEVIFQRALREALQPGDAKRFTAHMLVENARLSTEDGLVMQIHPGALRSYNRSLYTRFGPDKGADIPIRSEFTQNLYPLLDRFGNHPGLTLILFTLDETAYARELAPLAGHFPAVKLGPPWWFHDSLNGIERYFHQVIETAGLMNTVGFNDDTRAFPSIPARHDVWRRASANWTAGLVVRGIVDLQDACEMMKDLCYRLAKQAYRLERDVPEAAGAG